MAPGQHGQRVPVWSPRGCAVRAIPGTGRARASRWECCSAEQPGQVTDQHGTGPAFPTSQMHASGSTAPQGAPRLAPTGETPYRPPRPELVPRRCTPTPHRSSSIRYPHHLGVGRCLPHRPGRAGNPGRAGWGARHRDRQRPRLGATVFAAPVARSGAAAPRPDRSGRRIAGRASICHGWAARPCCRAQAPPDPPARRAGNGRAAWPDAHSAERHGREDDCRPGRRAGGVVRRRSASPRHRLRGPSPVARYLPRFGAAVPLCRAQALPDPPARGGLGMTDHGCGVQCTVRPTRASGHGVRDHATGLSNPPCVLRRARYPEAGVRQGADPSSAFLRGNREGAQPGAAPGVRLLSLPPCSWPSGGAEAAERAVRPRSPAHRRVRAAAPRPCSGRRRPRSPNPSASGHRNSPGIGQ